MPEVSKRGVRMPESPIRKLVPFADKAKAAGKKVYHLNIGQPDLPTPKIAMEAIQNIKREILEYSPSEGIRSYREKLVGYYKKFKIDIDANDIIITAGGSEAVTYAFGLSRSWRRNYCSEPSMPLYSLCNSCRSNC